MIHTINLYCTFSSLEIYNYTFTQLKNYVTYSQHNLHPDKNTKKNKTTYQYYKTDYFNDIGISYINLCRYFGSKTGSYIELIVNCPKLIYNGDETKLARNDDYNILEEKFNHIIQHLNHRVFSSTLLPQLNGWQVRRIDYAFDIDTPFVNDYICIFKKGYIPKGFSLKEYYDTSFHIKSKACNYNFYNKTEELDTKHQIHISSNILRLEVQCKADKIRKIINDYNIQDNFLYSLWNESIAKNVIAKAVNRVVDTYDFYPLNILQDKIFDSDLTKSYKHYAWQLTKLLNNDVFNLSELSQIITASEDYKKDIIKEILHLHKKRSTEKHFNKIDATIAINKLNYSYAKSYLNKINLSPIALPKNCQIEYLPNPIKLIK